MATRKTDPEREWPTDPLEAIVASYRAAVSAALAGERYAELEFQRPIQKDLAIRRIVTESESTGKALSYTAAERLVEAEPGYADHCAKVRNAMYEWEAEKAYAHALKLVATHRTAEHVGGSLSTPTRS